LFGDEQKYRRQRRPTLGISSRCCSIKCGYTHYRSRGDEAARLAPVFAVADPASGLQANGLHEPAAPFHGSAVVEAEIPAQAAFQRNQEEPTAAA